MKLTLRAARANYGLSAKEVAKMVGVHHQTLLKYEKDSTKIPSDLLEKLSTIYKLPKDQFFLGKTYEFISTLCIDN